MFSTDNCQKARDKKFLVLTASHFLHTMVSSSKVVVSVWDKEHGWRSAADGAMTKLALGSLPILEGQVHSLLAKLLQPVIIYMVSTYRRSFEPISSPSPQLLQNGKAVMVRECIKTRNTHSVRSACSSFADARGPGDLGEGIVRGQTEPNDVKQYHE